MKESNNNIKDYKKGDQGQKGVLNLKKKNKKEKERDREISLNKINPQNITQISKVFPIIKNIFSVLPET